MEGLPSENNFEALFERLDYLDITEIGTGRFFSKVLKARVNFDQNKQNLVDVAMKCVPSHFNLFSPTIFEQIEKLSHLQHKNIVELIDTATTPYGADSFNYLVVEYCEFNLEGLLRNEKFAITLQDVKSLMQQLFRGLQYIHSQNFVHGDLNPRNILITKDGIVKLGDTGVVQIFSIPKTLYYCAPEILLGDKTHGPKTDLWAAGCVFAELWTKHPIMQGADARNQLALICELCGSMNTLVWPGVDEMKLYGSIGLPADETRKTFRWFSSISNNLGAVVLLENLLRLNPEFRIDSDEAVHHQFFEMEPKPLPDLSHVVKGFIPAGLPGSASQPEPRPSTSGTQRDKRIEEPGVSGIKN